MLQKATYSTLCLNYSAYCTCTIHATSQNYRMYYIKLYQISYVATYFTLTAELPTILESFPLVIHASSYTYIGVLGRYV